MAGLSPAAAGAATARDLAVRARSGVRGQVVSRPRDVAAALRNSLDKALLNGSHACYVVCGIAGPVTCTTAVPKTLGALSLGRANADSACRLTCLLRTSCLCCVRLASLSHVVACGGPAGLLARRPALARGGRVCRPPGGGARRAGGARGPAPPGAGGPPRR